VVSASTFYQIISDLLFDLRVAIDDSFLAFTPGVASMRLTSGGHSGQQAAALWLTGIVPTDSAKHSEVSAGRAASKFTGRKPIVGSGFTICELTSISRSKRIL
jgi:hypothetical protein